LQQVDYRTVRRGRRAEGSGPLPQFDLGRWDAFDPDRTMQRLAVVPEAAPTPVWLGAHDDYVGPASSSEADMAATVEIVPEIDTDDILEAAPVLRPPLVLPPRASLPLDLNRLLAHARAETRKSVDYFHPSTPLPPELAAAVAIPHVADVMGARNRTDPTVAIARIAPEPLALGGFVLERRRRLTWIVGTVLAASVATVAVAAIESGVSSARSPESVTVTKPVAVAAAAPVPPAQTPFAAAPDSKIPTVSAQNLPQVESATISLAAVAISHRLFIDGRVAQGDSEIVKCGRHIVQVGSHGVRRHVDVACGQELVVAN
jgi:hypothetical protein